MSIKTVLKISRPKFWMYLAGTYLVGFTFGLETLSGLNNFFFFLNFLYFLIPANIFLYGINDYFDEDTDKYNDKKGTHEHKLISNEKFQLIGYLLVSVALFFFMLILQPSLEIQLLFGLYLTLAYFYSAPPIRFKSKPIADFSSNILYGLPGIIGYAQSSNQLPPLLVIVAIFCWTAAMHLFSAIPDIEPDKKAKLNTTAVILKKKLSILLCLFFWGIAALISILSIPHYIGIIAIIYPLIPFLLLVDKKLNIKKVYWYFPFINTIVGFILFLYAMLL